MNFQVHMMLVRILLVVGSMLVTEAKLDYISSSFHRSSFPKNFAFGTASSSYQYEGAYNKDGRTSSIWDTYTHQYPDVALMKDMGMDAYRFSISWSRILPTGKLSGGVNKMGVQHYNNLINELLAKGVQPYVTIFHWDMPQTLENEFGGFLSTHIVSHFEDYAEVCFKEFGDRVKHWITLNEPWAYANFGYNLGTFAPNRCSINASNCNAGDSSTEPYIVAHNQLLAHATVVKLYREKYQATQKGIIGISLVSHWMVPASNSKADKNAAQRAIDFMLGWLIDPLTNGIYPKSMQSLVGKRLPKFTKEQSNMIKGSYDFLGLNYYTANYATSVKLSSGVPPSYLTDSRANLATERNGIPIGPMAGSPWLFMYPSGLHELLLYIKYRYNNPVIYITENGFNEINNSTLTLKEALVDNLRIDYHRSHLKSVLKSIRQGVDVRGYFAWSFLDNFEWADGYSVRFGIYYVDFKTLNRYPKLSATWFKKFLHNI